MAGLAGSAPQGYLPLLCPRVPASAWAEGEGTLGPAWCCCSPPFPRLEPGQLLLFSCQVVSNSLRPQGLQTSRRPHLSSILSRSLPKFTSMESVMNQASSLDLGGLCYLWPCEGRRSGFHGLEHVRACLLAFSGCLEGSPIFQMRKLEEQGRDCLQQGLKARPRLWEEGGDGSALHGLP